MEAPFNDDGKTHQGYRWKMTAEVRFSTQAIQDLDGIHKYIAPLGGDVVARNFVSQIYEYCLGFETFPERGMLREDLRPGLRLVGYRR